MADGLQVFTENETPPYTKMNKLGRRVTIDCANRNGLPSSPAEGMQCFLLDTREVVWWNGSAWFSRPNGWQSESTTYDTGSDGNSFLIIPALGEVVINGTGVSVAATGHSRYRYTCNFEFSGTSGGDLFAVKLWRQQGSSRTQLGQFKNVIVGNQANDGALQPYSLTEVDYPNTGSASYFATIEATGGNQGGGRTIGGDHCWVEHIGGPLS